jgi:hypothetical protein
MIQKEKSAMDMLRDIHQLLLENTAPADNGPGEIDKLASLLTSILRLQTQQIDLLRGLSERVGRITPR